MIQNLGHSCFLVESLRGTRVLFDPFLTGNLFATAKAAELTDIHLIAVSHGAFDHLGDAVFIAKSTGARLFCGPEVALHAFDEGLEKEQVCQMVWGTKAVYRGLEIRSVEARHISLFKSKNQFISGIPMSFILRMEDGTGIYFSGDTSIFSDLKLFGQLYPVKIGLFGMGGLPGYPMEMSGYEASLAAQWLGVEVAIPMHHPPDSPDPVEFRDTLSSAGPSVRVVLLKPGESYIYSSGALGSARTPHI